MPDVSRQVSGKQWIAWKRAIPNQGQSSIQVAKTVNGEPKPAITVYQTKDDLINPEIEVGDNEAIHLVWVESTQEGWDLFSATLRRSKLKQKQRLTHDGESFRPKLRGQDGVLWLTWQSRREGNLNVYAKQHKEGKWKNAVRLSHNRSANRAPDIDLGPEGQVWVTWDSYRNGNYDIYLRGFDPGRAEWSSPKRLTSSMKLDMEPSIAVDPAGRAWVVWVRAPRWGEYHYRLNVHKRLILRGYNPSKGNLVQVKGRGLADRQGIIPMQIDARGRQLPVSPTIVAEANGALHIFYRRFRDRGGNDWGWCVDQTAATEEGWIQPRRIGSTPGFQASEVAARPAGGDHIALAFQAVGYQGGRSPVKDSNSTIYTQSLPTETGGSPNITRSILPADKHLEEFDVPRPPLKKPAVWRPDDQKRRLLWGQLHQHTSQSKDVPERDGSLRDAYRWAHDLAQLDFFTTTDHTEMMSDQEAHRTRIWADLYNNPGEMITLYGAEQNFKTTEHSNFFAIDRRPARLYRRARLDYETLPKALAWLEDKGLRGRVLVIRHFHGRTPRTSAPPLVPGFEHDIEAVQTRGFAPKALDHYLDQKTHPGVVGGPDHSRPPGGWGGPWVFPYALTGVWAKSAARDGVFNALYNRRAYATNGKKIEIRFSANGHPLGSTFTTGSPIQFKVNVTGTAPLKEVRLIRNGETIVTKSPNGTNSSFRHKETKSGQHYYYVRVVQQRMKGDNYRGRAVTSPIWIDQEDS